MLTQEQREALVRRVRGNQNGRPDGIRPRPAGLTELPLSFGQEQLWFIDQFAPGQAAYNIPLAISLSGPLDAAAVVRALDGLIARHEVLRTRLSARHEAPHADLEPIDADPAASASGGHGYPVQVIDAVLPRPLEVVDLQAPGLTEPAATAASLTDLVTDYTRLIRTAQPDGPYRLAGWSMGGVIAAAEQLAWLAGRLDVTVSDSAGAHVGQPAGGQSRASIATQLSHRFALFRAHARMLAGYQPAAVPPVRAPALIVSPDGSLNAPASACWLQVLSGPVSMFRVNGDHYDFLRSPLVADVAAAIRGGCG